MAPCSWRRYGEIGVLLEFAKSEEVLSAYRYLRAAPAFDECVPGATTIYIESNDRSIAELLSLVESVLSSPAALPSTSSAIRTHIIDVRYDGIDLDDVATLTGMSVDEVIARHSGGRYTVAFLGFSRGFAYLEGLDPQIVVPRLSSPRTSVPAGSVAMGAGYTGIYPMSSPGGWRLLGTTEFEMFDPTLDPPNALMTGDQVRFNAL